MENILKPFMLTAATLAFSATVFAQEEMAEAPMAEPAESSESEEETPLLSGFIVSSISFQKVGSAPGAVGFSMDEVELDLDKSWEKVAIRGDIEIQSDFSTATGFDIKYNVEQAYMQWMPSDKITLTMGRFLVPIGWELIDPVDRLTYENANIFNYGVPFYGQGFLAAIAPGGIFDIQLYVTSGLEVFYGVGNPVNVGTRIGLSLSDSVGLGLSTTYNHNDQFVSDIDFTASGEGWVLGLEANMGGYINRSDMWYAGLVEFNKSLTDDLSITLRSDYFQDTNSGDRLGLPGDSVVSGTVALPFYVAEAARLMLDYTMKYQLTGAVADNKVAFQAAYNF